MQKHTFDDDGNGYCDTCPLPHKNPIHDVVRPAVNEPAPIITVNQTATSQAAGEAARIRSGSLREAAYRFIASRPGGATTEEVEIALERSHQSVSSAINSLTAHGHLTALVRNGAEVQRATRSGRSATVYVIRRAA
jgi:hypothetical protein